MATLVFPRGSLTAHHTDGTDWRRSPTAIPASISRQNTEKAAHNAQPPPHQNPLLGLALPTTLLLEPYLELILLKTAQARLANSLYPSLDGWI
jgi:hypothetical protein